MERQVKQLVEYCRHLEKATPGAGVTALKEITNDGEFLKASYYQIEEAIKRHDVPFEVIMEEKKPGLAKLRSWIEGMRAEIKGDVHRVGIAFYTPDLILGELERVSYSFFTQELDRKKISVSQEALIKSVLNFTEHPQHCDLVKYAHHHGGEVKCTCGLEKIEEDLNRWIVVDDMEHQPRLKALVTFLKEEKAKAEGFREKDRANADKESEANETGMIDTIDKVIAKMAELDPGNPLFKDNG